MRLIKLESATKLPTTWAKPQSKCSVEEFFKGEELYKLEERLLWGDERNEAFESMELLGDKCKKVSILDLGVGESSSIGIEGSSSCWFITKGVGGCDVGWLRVKKANVEEANDEMDRGVRWTGAVRVCCGVVNGIGAETDVFTRVLLILLALVKEIVQDRVSPA